VGVIHHFRHAVYLFVSSHILLCCNKKNVKFAELIKVVLEVYNVCSHS